MIGLVVVSHSAALARAAVDLALEMVTGDPPPIAVAAGAGGGGEGAGGVGGGADVTGTDAVRIAEAITDVSGRADGVLVLMDLGSALLSAEMALELLDADPPPGLAPVRLCAAPFVEGLLAAVVTAAGGADLAAVEAEAVSALAPKAEHLGQPAPTAVSGAPGEPRRTAPADVTAQLTVSNAAGLHARPAARIVAALAGLDATLTLTNRRTGATPVPVSGTTSVLLLDARAGDVLTVEAAGPDARAAVAALQSLAAEAFGEAPAPAPPAPAPAAPSPAASSATGAAIGVSAGQGAGPVVHLGARPRRPGPSAPLPGEQRGAAADRVLQAADRVAEALEQRAAALSGAARDVVAATAALARDPALREPARRAVVHDGASPQEAIWRATDATLTALRGAGGLAAQRLRDVEDVRDRIACDLDDLAPPGVPQRSEPFVLVADDLAPADAAQLDPATCRAIITRAGGPTSHTAILARALGIPAVIDSAIDVAEGTVVLVDGSTGLITRDPSPQQLAQLAAQERPEPFDGTGRTADGHRVPLLANVGSGADVAAAVACGAEGVGLFRTEFAFGASATAPSRAEQVAAYRGVLAGFPGRRVVVRTLDAGADKPLPFVHAGAAPEENPALGVRGYRLTRRRPELLEDQLAAIAEAATLEDARVDVMAPMVSTAAEAADFSARCRAHGITRPGVMIETPSAAVCADDVLAATTFASLGTNDLAQYTMAADRMAAELADLNDPWQPALLRLVRSACEAGARRGVSVGVCGEAAADPALAVVLVGLGVGSLSMSAPALTAVAARLRSVTLAGCRAAADAALGASSAAGAKAAAQAAVPSAVDAARDRSARA